MFTRITLIATLLVIAVNVAPAQNYLSGTQLRLVEPNPTQQYGGVLIPPTPTAADVIFTFPSTGGYLLVDDGSGKVAWLVGGNPLTATGLLGSTTAQDVSFIAGGTSNVRMRLEDDAKAVSLPDQTSLRLMELTASGSNYTEIAAQAQVGNITYTLPNTVGSAGQVLAIADVPAPTATSATLMWKTQTLPGNIELGYIPVSEQIPASCDIRFTYNATTAGTYMIKSHMKWTSGSWATKKPEICWNLPTGATISYKWVSIDNPTNLAQQGTSSTTAATQLTLPDDTEEFSITGTITVTTPGTIDFRLGKTGGTWLTLEGSYMIVIQP
ncbi:MAG: hypothetical protein HYX66_09150 [Ignavibacteria bacterium]|nr:hypothetical protein [Ignavibacteria bacterium]